MLFDDKKTVLIQELSNVFNRLGVDTATNIPDHILANYTYIAIEGLRDSMNQIDNHYGFRKIDGRVIKSPK